MFTTLSDGDVPWHGIPHPKGRSVCNVHLLQAGGLYFPNSLILLPGPNVPTPDYGSIDEANKTQFWAPDFCFLIEHTASGNKYIFDLGMPKDLDSDSPPALKECLLSSLRCFPESPVEIIQKDTSGEHSLDSVKAAIFSHLHFDHIGDILHPSLRHAELWVGPTSMVDARPGYPADPKGFNRTIDFPADGSRKIVEITIPDEILEAIPEDDRLPGLANARDQSRYTAIEQRQPTSGWFPLGSYERACDLFGDGSAYAIDAPGHLPGHMQLLLRVKINETSENDDDFVLLAGDCCHHPALLRDPRLTARPPFSTRTLHVNPEMAMDTMVRTSAFARQQNVWVVLSHDFLVVEALNPGERAVEGIVRINEWRTKGWKGK